ncbi:NAD(P)/FAD-dependent oxidoreductase [Flaviaesturariibacter flavus]|nr:FAD-binding oxidoreductase [Flaviaesturariibacter flavus]
MNVDYLIVGQGIAGTMLAWFLHLEGKSFAVIDNGADVTASKVAAGIINPVTGRRYHTTWKADELHPFALKTYSELGTHFNTHYIFSKDIIEFFPSADARNIFIEKVQAGNTYMDAYPDQNRFNGQVNYDFGCGRIAPAYVTSLGLLLADMRRWLRSENRLVESAFETGALQLTGDGVRYEAINAGKVIFCEGASGAENPWFRLLPWALNKGEALIIECRDLEQEHLMKKGFLLAPLPVQHTFWAGSNYAWEGLTEGPTEAFRTRTSALLDAMLKLPYSILAHKAAVRPATVERRPFVGLHPLHPQIGILNGLGTKGTSLAPYFAQQLLRHLTHGSPLTPEADVNRFTKTLAR